MAVQFHETTLPNGLTILAESNQEAHTAALGFFVRTGARDEDRKLMGVSHFLEHMMFKGTDRRTADDVNREFDEIGADYNAYTSHEQTVFFARVLPEYLPRAADLLGDILRPALRDDDFEMEKNVILEEIGMYEDRPQWRLQDTLLEVYFGRHPLGFRVLGTNETIQRLSADQMRGYFGHRYSADNITVAAAGRLDFDALVRDVEKLTASWQPTGAQRDHEAPDPCHVEHDMPDAKLQRHYLAMMCPGPSAQDEQRYAARVLADVLGDSDGSRLYWALVDPGLAEEADLSALPFDQAGGYFAYASCDPHQAEQVERTLLATIDQALGDLNREEVERAKNKLATQATLQGENPAGRMRELGSRWQYLGSYASLEEELERLMSVSMTDLQRLIEAYPFQPRTIVRLGPGVGA